MAKFSHSSGSLFLNVYVDQISQDIAGNSSTISYQLTVSRTGAYYTHNHAGDSVLSLYMDGRHIHQSNPRWQTSGEEYTLASGTTVIGHQADGTKSFDVSATFNPNNGLHGTITVNAHINLTTIPRASSLSVASGVIGSSLSIAIHRQSPSFTHTLRYAWGNRSETIATNVGTSYSWTIPMDFARDIPDATSGVGTIYVDTYSGSTKTGTQQVNFSASVPASIKPSFSSLTLTDMNTAARGLLTGNNFLQIISDIQVTFNGTSGSYDSTITGYRAEIVNRNQVTTVNGGRLGMMNFNGSATIRAYVIDSRGRQSDTRDITINVIEYFAPALSFTAVRTRMLPNIIQVIRNAKIAPITLYGSQKNVMTLTFKVAPLGSTSYTADNDSASGTFTTQHTLTNLAANLSRDYPANQSFIVIGTLSDKFTSVDFSTVVATESVVMSYDKDGRVGIGKIAEHGKAGSLDVLGDIYAGGKLIQQHQLTQSDGILKQAFNDWNNYVTTGFYWGYQLANSPNELQGTHLFKYIKVFAYQNDWCVQEAVDFNGMTVWVRTFSGGIWKPWIAPGLNQFYPIGSIYQSTNATDPSTLMGGTWQRFGQGRVLVGVNESDSDFNTVNRIGGSKTHKHGKGNMVAKIGSGSGHADTIGFHHDQNHLWGNPTYVISGGRRSDLESKPLSHNTAIAGETSDSSSLQPYVTVYMWQRIA